MPNKRKPNQYAQWMKKPKYDELLQFAVTAGKDTSTEVPQFKKKDDVLDWLTTSLFPLFPNQKTLFEQSFDKKKPSKLKTPEDIPVAIEISGQKLGNTPLPAHPVTANQGNIIVFTCIC